MALALAAAVSVFVAIVAVVLLLLGRSTAGKLAERRLEEIRRPAPREEWLEGSDLLRRESSTVPILRRVLASGWSDRALTELQQAGIRLKVSEYFLLRLLIALLSATLVLLLTHAGGIGIVLAILAAGVGYMAPALYVHIARDRRTKAISAQLVETLQLMSNALRSGFAFTQAIQLTAEQMAPPIQNDLQALLRDLALGARMDDSLRALVKRTGSLDMELVVTTVIVQRTTGGNLSEVLDNVANTVAERERLKGEIRALTAQQRLTGLILSIYPVGLGLLLALISPSVMKYLWQEELGRILLVIAVGLQALGAFTIQRILRIEV